MNNAQRNGLGANERSIIVYELSHTASGVCHMEYIYIAS